MKTDERPTDCGCCEGVASETPETTENPPGQPAIRYRVGTHSTFKSSMLAGLSSALRPALVDLNTRDDDDFSIALADAWATVADVLTFYQERAANEAFLRTATERTSLVELARLIGYELRPGVAANAYLAFELEPAKGAPAEVTVPIGTKVQSVPGPDETPQVFETVEAVQARPEWNALRPLLLQPQRLTQKSEHVLLAGTGLNVAQGDEVLIVDRGGAKVVRTLRKVVEDTAAATTRLELTTGTAPWPPFRPTRLKSGLFPSGPTTLTLQEVENRILGRRWKAADLLSVARSRGWSLKELTDTVQKALAAASPGEGRLFAFRGRAAVFGHNAPEYESLPANLRIETSVSGPTGTPVKVDPAYPTSWEKRTLLMEAAAASRTGGKLGTTRFKPVGKTRPIVDLDAVYPKFVGAGFVVLEHTSQGASVIHEILGATELSLAKFTLTGKATRLTLDSITGFGQLTIRGTTVRGESQELALARVPIPNPIQGDRIVLDGFYLGLERGRTALLTGEPVALPGVVVSEVVTFDDVTIEDGLTVLRLHESLKHSYVRASVTINANVALSTNGETTRDVLGSGDGTQGFQRFELRQPPLTYVSASTPSGTDSTLTVRVNGVRWHEVPTFYGQGPTERVYVTRLDAKSKTTVEFGDGLTGARLSTGAENVEAAYRKGIGLGGLVRAGQLTLPLTKPMGVKAVSNPLPAADAADPEPENEARSNAPLTVLTLDRVVALRDFEDFARGFAGIAKALATWIWDPRGPFVLITVAGPNGAVIDESGVLANNLTRAIREQGDPTARFQLRSFRPAPFELAAKIKVDPDRLPERVRGAVELVLRERFSFEARAFGQSVPRSEVEATIQGVDGVVAVDLDQLFRTDTPSPPLSPRLFPAVPAAGDSPLLGAELLTLDARRVSLTEMT